MTGILNLLAGSIASVVKDTYFNLVTLLLPGNGTNGKQNNAFQDSSSNNFQINVNGNTTQGTFSPFSQTGWSTFFPSGTTDTLRVDGSTNLNSTGDFTWECWGWYLGPPAAAYNGLVTMRTGANVGGAISISNTDVLYYAIASTGYTHSAAVPREQWFHVAMVRSGSGTNNVSCYLNGSRIGQFTSTSELNGNNKMQIGQWECDGTASGYNFNGYISNVRYVTGSALYSGTTYTVPTAPLTAVSGTQVLTCQSNRWVDNSSNNYGFTVTAGTPSVQAFSPFAPSGAYDPTAVGGSGYFDGTGDYLSVADNANLRLGTSAFTIQAWIYRSAAGTAHSIIAKGGASTGFVFQVTSGNILRFTHTTTNVDTTTTIPASTWTHVAAVRTNTSTNGFQLYINGVSSVTATVSTDFSQTETLYIAADRSAATPMNGYISGLKYTNGTAESISVPTAPPTATTNVALLTNFTNAGITDATAKNDLETVGNAQISTTQSKFGGSSMYFDGTGDYLVSKSSPLWALGTGDFTIELWFYSGSIATRGHLVSNSQWQVFTYSSKVYFGNGATDWLVGGTTLSNNTWYHIAISRSGTSLKLFVNGTQDASATNSTDFSATTNALIVGALDSSGTYPLNGYIDDLRVTKGYARYTANFTAPTAAFPVQ